MVTYLDHALIFEWCVVRHDSKNGYPKNLFERDWTTCSKYDNHHGLISEHNWGTYMNVQSTWEYYH